MIKFQPGFRSFREGFVTVAITLIAATVLFGAAKPKVRKNGIPPQPVPCFVIPNGNPTCEYSMQGNLEQIKSGVNLTCLTGTFPNMCVIDYTFWVEHWTGTKWVVVPGSLWEDSTTIGCGTKLFKAEVTWFPSHYFSPSRGILQITRSIDGYLLGTSTCYSD